MNGTLENVRPMIGTLERRSQAIGYLLLSTVVIGLDWRFVRYFSSFPIWGDEAMLLLNVLDRDYAGLTETLKFAQAAPLFFLWLEKTAILRFGVAEWSVHLFPFIAGLLCVYVFWLTCRASFKPMICGIAVAILAVSYYPVRHSVEVKPYVFDMLFATLYASIALGHMREPKSRRWLLGLIVLAPTAVFTSYPSAFVGGAVSVVLLPWMRNANWSQRALYLLFNFALVGAFLLNVTMIGQPKKDLEDANRSRDFLLSYWKDAFPPESVIDWPIWLARSHTGNMLAYPIGSKNGGSTLTFLLVLVGSVSIWRSGQHATLALCWLPFALNLVAAMLHKYPYGESARIAQHLAPFICILMAHGIGQCIAWLGSSQWQMRTEMVVYALLLSWGIFGVARDILMPYKTKYDYEVRKLALELQQRVGDERVWLCHEQDTEVAAELAWYLRSQLPNLEWLRPSEEISTTVRSCWLVRYGVLEPSLTEVAWRPGWRVLDTGMLAIPPANTKRESGCLRWVRIARE